jgi:hypothetical protein
MGKLSDF